MNGTYGTTTAVQQTGPKLIDDFLRRELRVGDPHNAMEVVTALRQRYATDAARIDQEAAGLPILYQTQPLTLPAAPAAGYTPGSKEERRVQVNLESDLAALIESRDNREWAPEIRGWRDALLREFSDGSASARFAHDPAMRDRGFLAVRRLGEFARVARLVGVLNLPLNCDYRRLASTLDDAANVIRILMGEALFVAGLADGGIIIQVPLVDVRQRRDSLVRALCRLAGLSDPGFDGDWGDDIAAYSALLDEIDRRSAPELKVYLREELLAPILDGLVGSVSRQDPEALRQVAATAPVEIARMQRLLDVVAGRLQNATSDISAALSAFAEALKLFVDAFSQSRSCARLIDLALPLPMAAQQTDEADAEGRQALLELIILRGAYAREVECFLSCCGCETAELACQVKLDKFLYDLDRAIDLYALASVSGGPEEQRASIYKFIADALAGDDCVDPQNNTNRLFVTLVTLSEALARALPGGAAGDALKKQVFDEQSAAERDWEILVRSLAPNCFGLGRVDPIQASRDLLAVASGLTLNFTHIRAIRRPQALRISLQQLAIAKTTYAGKGPTTQRQTTRPGGRRSTARDAEPRDRAGARSAIAQPPGRDPELVSFVETLSRASESAGELRSALTRDQVWKQWTALKSREARTGKRLPKELVDLVDDLLDTSRPTHIDRAHVREVFRKILSREPGE